MDISCVFSCDKNYVPFLGTSICSLISNANDNNNYYIYILDGGIDELNKTKLLKMLKSNIFIEFIDISKVVTNLSMFYISGHISVAAYYRLFLSEIFKTLEKIIYVDCDVIFKKDIAYLFEVDVDDYYLAAVKDIGLIYKEVFKELDLTYFNKKLMLLNISEYFNSGVLLLNLKKLREIDATKLFLDKLQNLSKPLFHDQCVLNAVCRGHVKYLPFKFNYWGNFKAENPDWEKYFPKKYKEEFNEAAKAPFIIHGKPWENPNNEFSEDFFYYARKTPFYEEILYKSILNKVNNQSNKLKRKKKKYNILGIKIKI